MGGGARPHQPRYAVLYEDNFNYLSKMCLLRMREAAFTMIEMAKARGCTVILCGADATDHAGRVFGARRRLSSCMGEGEETLGELLDRLQGRTDTPLESIRRPGLAGSATAASGTARAGPTSRDLDDLPFPAWDLVDIRALPGTSGASGTATTR